MSPTLSPLSNLSSGLDVVKIDIACTARPVEGPTLPSQNSFTPSTSQSVDTSTSSRRTRPSLSPEALLIHAFGPSALIKLVPSANEDPPSSRSVSSPICSSSRESMTSQRRRQREKIHEIHNSLAAAPPPGTFRSVAKPVKTILTRFPPSEPKRFQVNHDDSLGEQRSVVEIRDCEIISGHEPPMSPVEWREKMGGRLQRRKLLRRKNDAQGATKLPLDIDSRPMAGSMNLPPTSVVPKTHKQRMHERNCLLPTASLGILEDVEESKA